MLIVWHFKRDLMFEISKFFFILIIQINFLLFYSTLGLNLTFSFYYGVTIIKFLSFWLFTFIYLLRLFFYPCCDIILFILLVPQKPKTIQHEIQWKKRNALQFRTRLREREEESEDMQITCHATLLNGYIHQINAFYRPFNYGCNEYCVKKEFKMEIKWAFFLFGFFTLSSVRVVA